MYEQYPPTGAAGGGDPPAAASTGRSHYLAWYPQLDKPERRTFWACFAGWMLDAMDVQTYAVMIPTLLALWHLTKGQAGVLGTSALIVSSIGGWVAGVLADRFGRVRILQITVVWFTVFSLLAAFCQDYTQLLVVRSLQGLGFGGEWAAGAALMSEAIRPEFRGRVVGVVASSYSLGYGLAAIAATITLLVLPPDLAWRVMFALGMLPALLVVFIRRYVGESAVFEAGAEARKTASGGLFLEIFSGAMIGRTLLACLLTAGALGGNYVMLTWLPTYLKQVQHLSVSGTGLYLFINIAGSFAGHIVSAHLSDAIGRRKTFLLMSGCSILTVLGYTLIPMNGYEVLLAGIPLGFFTSGIVTNIGAWFAEFYPTRVRGSGQGFTYNFGRGIGAFAPSIVGFASGGLGLGAAMATCAACAYGLVFVAALMLPETRGKALAE